jgi:hypothetical protein
MAARTQAGPDGALSLASVEIVTGLMFATDMSELRFWIPLALREGARRTVSAQEKRLQRRDDHQQQNWPHKHTANDHSGEWSLDLTANAGRDGGRKQADAGR